MTREEIYRRIDLERGRQNKLHPDWRGEDHGLAVLMEEVGEVAKSLNELDSAKFYMNALEGDLAKIQVELQEELVQVAAVCIRWLENMK